MNPATATLIIDGLSALTNLMIRLMEAKMAAGDAIIKAQETGEDISAEEMEFAADALRQAIQRAEDLLKE